MRNDNELRAAIANLSRKIEGLSEIPANEQCLGHFQVAVQDSLRSVLDILRTLRDEVHP